MTDLTLEWREREENRGVELSISESQALWEFFQREDCPPYWEQQEIAAIANKLKSFGKYGPWDPLPRTDEVKSHERDDPPPP